MCGHPALTTSPYRKMMNEVWHPVLGYEGLYEVSDQGRVRSVDRWIDYSNGKSRVTKGRILAQSKNSGGYLQISLWKDNVGKSAFAHKLVAEAFLGPRPDGLQIRHGPKGKEVNTPENLCYGTGAENCADQLRDGTRPRGETQGRSKLTEDQVLEIYFAPRTFGSGRKLAKYYGVGPVQISRIRKGKHWAWLTSNINES